MREYLFKGKRLDNGEWIEGDLSQDRDLGKAYIHGYDYYTDECGLQREPFEFEVDPETVGPFTGATDAVGTKIFDGDIIWDGDWECVGEIQWTEDYLSWMVVMAGGEIEWFQEFVSTKSKKAGSSKVIGNRWDNPELLEGV